MGPFLTGLGSRMGLFFTGLGSRIGLDEGLDRDGAHYVGADIELG